MVAGGINDDGSLLESRIIEEIVTDKEKRDTGDQLEQLISVPADVEEISERTAKTD